MRELTAVAEQGGQAWAAQMKDLLVGIKEVVSAAPAGGQTALAPEVQQKISGCFRSPAGAQAFCRIRGYISTLRKQGSHVFTALEQVFRGDPPLPSLSG